MEAQNDQLMDDDPLLIALYYCYTPRPIPPTSLPNHVEYHQDLCARLNLNGRIRVSSEGINGVLSGNRSQLIEYERSLHDEVARILHEDTDIDDKNKANTNDDADVGDDASFDLDVKYCKLRPDIPEETQLFHTLSVKQTSFVVSLFEQKFEAAPGSNRRGGRRGRRWKKKQEKIQSWQQQQQEQQEEHPQNETQEKDYSQPDASDDTKDNTGNETIAMPTSPEDIDLMQYPPAQHLSPQEWNQHLEGEVGGDAILLDARNVYESRVGHFAIPGVPTILPNTRKYSSLPAVFDASSEQLAGRKVYMYCTGGVRCERASAYLQALADSERWKGEKPKRIYQLKGGIQRYLETYGSTVQDEQHEATEPSSSDNNTPSDACLYKGKNFVFDPRRTDPVIGPGCPGRCLLCDAPHDDYDNGHAPCENKEARCCRCRVLVLVCNDCRSKVRIWGEEQLETSPNKPDLHCGPGGKECIDEGNKISVQIVTS